MSDFVTLRKSDSQFKDYLLGSFSKTHRALPVKTLNPGTDFESVTFEIVASEKINKAPFFKFWIDVFKLSTFALVAFPLFLVLTKIFLDTKEFSRSIALTSVFGVFCLFTSANFRNDLIDHLRGVDRIHPQSIARPLQKGWLTGRQVLWLSHVFAILGVVLGIPALLSRPSLLVMLTIVTAFVLVGLYSYRFGLKYRLWSELAVLMLMGPMLTVGFELAVSGSFDFETVLLGLLSGWLSVFNIHLKNFKNLMVNFRVGFENTVTYLGFEKAKTLLKTWWILFLMFWFLYQWVYSPLWQAVSVVLLSFLSGITFYRGTRSLKSPLGSQSLQVVTQGRKWVLATLVFWSLQCLWNLSYI